VAGLWRESILVYVGFNNPSEPSPPTTATAVIPGDAVTASDQAIYSDILAPAPTGAVDYEQLEASWSLLGLVLTDDEYVNTSDLMALIPEIAGIVKYEGGTYVDSSTDGDFNITADMGVWAYCSSDVTGAHNYSLIVQKY